MLKPNQHHTPSEWLKQLQITYYVFYVLIVALFGVIWYMNDRSVSESGEPFRLFSPNETAGLTLQYIAIGYTLVIIPWALYGMKRTCAKIALIEDEALKYDTYYTYAYMRMGAIGMSVLLSLVAYMLLGAYNPMIWLAAIGAVALVFTKPSAGKTEDELQAPDPNAPTY